MGRGKLFLWKEFVYLVAATTSSMLLNYIIQLHVLSHIINHEHVAIAFANIINVALQRVLRKPLTATLNNWNH